jgi:Domain of unknown function (DUF397)
MTERRLIDELIERSSLGTPGAKSARSQTPDEVVRELRRRFQELEGEAHPEQRLVSRLKVSVVRSSTELEAQAAPESEVPVSTGRARLSASPAEWRKSPHSGEAACVEVAFIEGKVAVRDSKHRGGPMLLFTADEWEAFLGAVRDGEFDTVDPESSSIEGQIAVQDSEDEHGPALMLSPPVWGDFLGAVRSGDFDLPETE